MTAAIGLLQGIDHFGEGKQAVDVFPITFVKSVLAFGATNSFDTRRRPPQVAMAGNESSSLICHYRG
ncbi:hypothetical protein FHX48_001632 [Microbacterium halimionae]|uniref:Uncharacterized protein n=1 Tax=Microbacterium halimionae TaxID=1526413 RepID=A0A7W3JPH7_9MICO|nr:hypothetical protein [Microbacterium halimionae]MBA8816559.1 hypothetical protein [Microbacterium halimionae]NII95254.1 hypothetical protein [Microbacterium halimionae]